MPGNSIFINVYLFTNQVNYTEIPFLLKWVMYVECVEFLDIYINITHSGH